MFGGNYSQPDRLSIRAKSSLSTSFTRTYSLPDDVAVENLVAKVVDGKLVIEGFKKGSTKSVTRSIPIPISSE
ncbi:hypothetical protein PRIPAC_88767 [Pristionchus pacificus]|uniref:SHSP domain-containing protein n=1 Tax=Pristionchus pacificus TaxID=54126 RepID=A0A2A6CZ43_PRIPA|nr:hypothetical protein PRIPAC_88767 [Pristionchus pacificus]|eukprot:PDM83376.1 hypothetical protein PRIPAC_35008 [Pristionchus pacificus]